MDATEIFRICTIDMMDTLTEDDTIQMPVSSVSARDIRDVLYDARRVIDRCLDDIGSDIDAESLFPSGTPEVDSILDFISHGVTVSRSDLLSIVFTGDVGWSTHLTDYQITRSARYDLDQTW